MLTADDRSLVRADELSVTYSTKSLRVEALRAVTFAVRPGEHVAILGPSGSGKSTLLHALGGLRAATSGRLVVGDHDISSATENDLADHRLLRVGTIFQQFYLLGRLTALDNVAVPAVIRGRSWRAARAQAAELLGAVGLGDRLKHRPHELSGGEQQRIAIARALINEPRLLLADEPTGSLDSETAATVLDLLDVLSSAGTTLLVVTHDDRVAARADRIMRMSEGRLVPEAA
jgi:putative ABC transport system ATP-binding protein